MLRCVVAPAVTERPTPRVLGVDDWAWRKGQTYGTILVDLERRHVVDLLPGRAAPALAAWLRAHPGAEIVSRDRGGEYAEAVRTAAPDAVHVADRFHLLRNLVDAVERVIVRHGPQRREQPTSPSGAGGAAPAVPNAEDERARRHALRALTRRRPYSATPTDRPGPTAREQESARRRAARLARYERVVALAAAGVPAKFIVAITDLHQRTVRWWIRAGHFPERRPLTRRRWRPLDDYAAHIAKRHDEGLENAVELCAELRALAYGGSVAAVRSYLAERRVRRLDAALRTAEADAPASSGAGVAADVGALRIAARPLPSVRKLAWLVWRPDADLADADRAIVTELCARSPAVAECRTLALEFARLLRERDPNALRPWLAAAERGPLRGLAYGVRRDFDAVLAATCFRWSQGQVEGHVHRLKLVKRSMYGRASFDLLRRRVLRAV